MATIDDLEAELREERLDLDTVAVYGDQLQALGDPRGELIAIDLEIEHSGTTPLLMLRRKQLLETWLGPQLPNGVIRHGFIDLDASGADPVGQVRQALGGPAARWVRSVTAVGPPKQLADTIAAIAELPRPWVVRVILRQWDDKATPTVDAAAAAAFVRATPHLKRLEVDARRLFADLAHPALRRLRISGSDAIDSLRTGSLALPELAELDLAFQCHLATSRTAPEGSLFERLGEAMPKLIALDLSRNQPGFLDPHSLGGETALAPLLVELGCRHRLHSLVLPPITDRRALALVRAALPSMPELRA